jgi:hypothetical protein
MGYEIIKTGTDSRPVGPPQVVIQGQAQKEKPEKKISRKQIVNLLNYANFQDDFIIIKLKHSRFDHVVSIQAKPQPCTENELSCSWVNVSEVSRKLISYEFDSISLTHENSNLELKPELAKIDESGIHLILSEQYYPLKIKAIEHHACIGIKAQVIQNSVIFKGTLTEFSSNSFHVNISLEPPQTSQWINSDSSVEIVLSNDEETLYSGECLVVEAFHENNWIGIRLQPLAQAINRFKQKKFRSLRESIIPTPDIIFKHPFTKKVIELKILDLSGSGFSVEASNSTAKLFPGMIIPQIIMSFTKRFNITLRAQVICVNKIESQNNDDIIKLGMVIIDIDSESHNTLMEILHQAKDEHSYINNKIDLDELWDFFFESGFIYPEKYKFLQEHREDVKNTFKTIYTEGIDIARHFVFQKQGRINSHMSTIRFYEKSWLIHHHAARRSSLNSGGISVLNQIGRFINDSHRLYSTKMDFVFCYFRQDNKFPTRVFGGASRIIKNPKACSLDSFAYLHPEVSDQNNMIPFDWELEPTEPEDLFEFEAFYNMKSNGLMLSALDLKPRQNKLKEISQLFKKIGLKRNRYLYSLKKNGSLKAIIMVNISDLGLNLSDLTNSTTAYILDSENLPYNILKESISILMKSLSMSDSPILIYPKEYLEFQEIPYERTYNLWVLNMNNTDHYFRYLTRLLRFVQS